jgi:hypothetical protein
MASTQNKQKVSDMVFDVKEKLTDEEYKNIMDGLSKINEKKYVKIHYMVYDDCEDYPEPIQSEHNTICEVIYDDPHSLCYDIHHRCVLRERTLEVWKKYKNQKQRWPVKYSPDIGQTSHILIYDFEEL